MCGHRVGTLFSLLPHRAYCLICGLIYGFGYGLWLVWLIHIGLGSGLGLGLDWQFAGIYTCIYPAQLSFLVCRFSYR